MKTRRRQSLQLSIVGVVLLLVASVGAVWLQPEPVEASAGPIHIEAPAEMAEAFASILPAPAIAAAAPAGATGIGLVDPTSGVWHLRTRGGDPASFYFGNPGDYPIMGDWNCDTIDTPGLYRQSDGYVYLRNSNTQGPADIKFYFGDPGDVPLAGDFNGDGCDTVSIYRQTEGQVYIINELGENDGGLGEADYKYYFGNPGDKPFTGDFNNNGTSTVGLHRESTGFMYFRNTNTQGIAEFQFYFGDPGDRLIAGDWTGDGDDTPAIFRPGDRTMYLRYSNTQGNADEQFVWGESPYIPVAGNFGTLNSGVTVNVTGAPEALLWAVESLYQDLPSAPHLPNGLRSNLAGLNDRPKTQLVTGTASTSTSYGKQVGVVQANGDTILAVSDNGWEWRVVGAEMASKSRARWFGDEPRFVTLIGADWQYSEESGSWPTTPLLTNADSVHIYSVVPSAGAGAIVGFPRDTLVRASFGTVKMSKTMENRGPQYTVDALRRETSLPIEGYFHIGMGANVGVGNPPGFRDLVDAYGGFPFLVPYTAGPATEGDTFVNGAGALAFGRERMTLPHGDVDRTLGQGLLLKAAIAEVKRVGILAMPGLLSIMDDYVNTDLSVDDVLTFAATVYTVDPGQMPTLTGADLDAAGHVSGSAVDSSHGAYNQNVGTLPNVMIKGCWTPPTAWALAPQNYATFADLADGTLSAIPWACP